jgi:SAM-dependent methyltransferase
MSWQNHPWDRIYAKDGHIRREPFPGFGEVVRIFSENGCGRILDLGCGSGRHALHLAKAGFSVLGADISMAGLKLAHAWSQEKAASIRLAQIDMRVGLPFAASTFDGVFSAQVIHHARLDQVRTTIHEIHRILQPGGSAFISVAGRLDESGPFEEIEPATYVPQTGSEAGLAHHIFTEPDLRYEFRSFQVIEITQRAHGKVLAIWVNKR